MKEVTMASVMAGIIKKKKKNKRSGGTEEDAAMTKQKQTHSQPAKNRFSSMRQKLGERTTNFSLPSVRRRRNMGGKRYVKHSPFSRRSKQQFHGDEEEVVFVSPSMTLETDDDATISPKPEEGGNLHLLEHYSGVIPDTPVLDSPLSDVQGQELFKSPEAIVEKQKENKETIIMQQVDVRPKKKVRFHFEEEDDGSRYVPLSSLSGISPRSLETIVESTLDDDDASTSSQEGNFQVSFSPAKDLFLRTLAVERATALSMSEMAFKASVRHSIDGKAMTTSRSKFAFKLRAKIQTAIRHVSKRITLNDALGLAIVVMALINWSGASEYIIGNLQAFIRGSWNFGVALLGYSTTTSRTSTLYNYQQDPMGVWLTR